MLRSKTVILGCVMLGLFGCDEGEEPPMEERSRCEEETRDEEFHLGIEKQGAVMRVTFTDAEPAAPVRGLNRWTIALSEGEAPIEGAMLSVKAWMPDHGHGSPQPVEIEELGEGEYVLDPVNLFMAGFWEITVTAEMDQATDEAMFPFCVE
jgi:hypothetical protein